jgi:hypothetical protein
MAQKNDDDETQKFVFIIDEINRADLSRVFGELFYALEPGYRGRSGGVKTQYAACEELDQKDTPGPKFYIPKNVFIIGTMNDLDRSVESIDFALRRRFAWYELKADVPQFESVMGEFGPMGWFGEAKARYTRLNERIEAAEELGSAYQIGPCYYRSLAKYGENRFQDLWKLHLSPLLAEYVRGMPKARRGELLKDFEAAYESGTRQTQ